MKPNEIHPCPRCFFHHFPDSQTWVLPDMFNSETEMHTGDLIVCRNCRTVLSLLEDGNQVVADMPTLAALPPAYSAFIIKTKLELAIADMKDWDL